MKTENNKSGEIQREKLAVKIFRRIGVLLGRIQCAWAEWMNRKTARLSKRTLYISLVLFISISLVYNSIVFVGGGATLIGFGNIKTPNKVSPPKGVDDVYRAEVRRVKRFIKVMDSLHGAPDGRKTYDSIMHARPGLLDSARAMEKLMDKF